MHWLWDMLKAYAKQKPPHRDGFPKVRLGGLKRFASALTSPNPPAPNRRARGPPEPGPG